MKQSGSAKMVAFEAYVEWYSGLGLEQARAIYERLKSQIKELGTPGKTNPTYESLSDMFTVRYWASWPASETEEAKWPGVREKATRRLRRFLEFAQDFDQPIRVIHWNEDYAYLFLGNPDAGIIVVDPDKYLEFVPDVDYSSMTVNDVRCALGAPRAAGEGALIPAAAETSVTQSGVTEQLSGQQAAIEALDKQMKEVKEYKTEELARLKAEIRAKEEELWARQQALMSELKEKMEEMEQVKENLENQIYLLDSQIYSIRCYAGEVVHFAKILSGKNAPVTEPVVIHQKLRFLDEELGLLASLYEIQWDELGMFEEFLKNSPLALDTFAPNQRCVTLVRLSRNATQLGRSDVNPYSNMLKEYEYFHGRTVGIIIRNGENLYLGWTDEERVHITDDLIVSQVVTEIEPAGEEPKFTFESDRERWIKQQKENRKRILDGIISRSFIYNILQGVVDNSPILPLPAGVKLNKQSEYVIYSVADLWLTDNRYGNFTDIIEKCNAKVMKGDMVLTVQRLVPERDRGWGGYGGHYNYNRAWDNSRGRGERNRTHDCSVDDCTIYPVNLVEFDEPVSMTRYRKFIKPDSQPGKKSEEQGFWQEGVMSTENYEYHVKHWPEDEREFLEEYEYRKPHVFVSVKKTDSWRWDGYRSDARANFELYKDEYINLTYLNSAWLEWVITNKKLGGWNVGGKEVDYAYAIRYLKTAMDHIRKREEEEKALLDAIDPGICRTPEWQVRLSEWKLKAGVREITAYQAKRFAKVFYEEG